MSEEKKYSAKEAAIAVLKKAEEVLKKSQAMKKAAAFSNSEGPAPKGEIQPKRETQGEPVNPGARAKEQLEPDMNPKEQAEGNNKEWGTAPETYGTLKLAKFIGHMHSKRKSAKPEMNMNKAEDLQSKKFSDVVPDARKSLKKDAAKPDSDSAESEDSSAAPAAPAAAPAAVVAPAPAAAPKADAAAAAPVAAPAAAPAAAAAEKPVNSGNSPTRTNTETGGSSPGGASTGGVGSGIGGAGTGGAATGGASTGGAGTVNLTISGNSGTGSNSEGGGKGTPIIINISNVGGRTDAGNVASGDGPGAAGEGGKGEGSGGGGGGAAPDEPNNFSTSGKDKQEFAPTPDSDPAVAAMSDDAESDESDSLGASGKDKKDRKDKMVKSERSGMHTVEYHNIRLVSKKN